MARADAGFTLMELLVAMAAVAVLALMLGQAMRGGTQFWVSANRRAKSLEESSAALRFLQARLAASYPARDEVISAEGFGFAGSSTWLEWLTDLPGGWADAGGYHRAKLELADTGKGRELVFAWAPWQAEKQSAQALPLGQATDLHLSYWGSGDAAQPARWHELWENRRELPELVRLDISRPGGERQVMYVSLRIEAHAGCRIDAYAGRCRE